MSNSSDERIASQMELLSAWLGVLVTLLGGLVLAAWALDIPSLQGIRSGLIAMKANTALAFLLAGLSLLLRRREPMGEIGRIAWLLAAAVLAVGALTLCEYLSGRNLGIDQLLFRNRAVPGGAGLPGRMSPQTAISFLLIGLGLLLDGLERSGDRRGGPRDRSPAPLLALGVALLSLQALIGYAFGAKGFYVFHAYPPIAPHTALGFVLLSLGVLCAHPSGGPMAVFTADDAGGLVARRLLLAVLLIPPVLGWLRLAGERAGYYGTPFGVSLMVLSSMVTLGAVVWCNAASLSRLDRERRSAREALEQSEDRSCTERQQAEAGLRSVAAHARCILWHTDVEDHGGEYVRWGLPSYFNESAGQHFFPLPVEPGSSYHNAWFQSRLPEDQERMRAHGTREVRAGRSYRQEFRCRGADGQVHWFAEDVRIDPVGPGRWRAAGVCVDITERKQAETGLRERESRLSAIIDSAMDAIITIDEEQRITVFNQAAEQIFRCPRSEALGQPITRFIPERHRERHREHIRTFDRTGVTARAMSPGELSALRADGEEFPMEASISQARVGDQQLYTAILRDLSERRRMEWSLARESHIAATLQQAFLPRTVPECPGFSFGAIYRPALREAEVGGDFYDLFSLPDGKIGLLLGDVSGKGLAAATVATMARYMARAYALETESAAGVLTRLNHALCESLGEEDLFITAIYAVLDPETGGLRYANAGHWPALMRRGPGCQPLETHGAALGLIPGERYREEPFQLEPGDEVVLFTDGLVEIGHEDPAEELQAVQHLLTEPGHLSPQGLAERLHEHALGRSGGPLRDDVAILCLRCCDRVPRPAAAAAANAAVEAEEKELLQHVAGPAALPPPRVTMVDCTLTFHLEGDLDIGRVPAIEEPLRQLITGRPRVLVMDLQQVTYLDTAGVRLLLQAQRLQQAAGNSLKIVSGGGMVREVLTHCRLL